MSQRRVYVQDIELNRTQIEEAILDYIIKHSLYRDGEDVLYVSPTGIFETVCITEFRYEDE